MAEKPAAHTPGEGSRRILNRFPTVSEANDAEEASDHRIASVPFRLMPDGTPSLRPGPTRSQRPESRQGASANLAGLLSSEEVGSLPTTASVSRNRPPMQ